MRINFFPADADQVASQIESLNRCANKPLAVVVGDSINALGVVRSLGRERIGVVWLTSTATSHVLYSRFTGCIVVVEDLYGEGFIITLKGISQYFSFPPVLFVTHDDQVRILSDFRTELNKYYRFSLPSRDLVNRLLSKHGFRKIAESHGLKIPFSYEINNYEEWKDFMQGANRKGKWVVKPAVKNDSFENVFGKATEIHEMEDWEKLDLLFAGVQTPIIIQQKIPGPDSNVLFCLTLFDASRNCLASFSGKKLRQYKPYVGSTASAGGFLDPIVKERTIRFFKECGFQGMGSLEFKKSSLDGDSYVIEPTIGRTDLQSEVASINGCNMVAMYYYFLVGDIDRLEKIQTVANLNKGDRTWIRVDADIKACLYYLRRKELTYLNCIRPYFSRVSFSLFRFSDPMPSLIYLRRSMLDLVKRSLNWILHRVVYASKKSL